MQKKPLLFGVLAVAVIAAIGGYSYFSRPVKAPSAPAEETVKPVVADQPAGGSETPGEEPFRIVAEDSRAEFAIDEVLRGNDFTVIGTTNQISGEIIADRNDLDAAKIGTIRVNARTLKTDSQQRDGAISRLILKSEQDSNEFIEFVPKSVSGLSESAALGESFSFQVAGDLKISGTTRQVTFSGNGTFVDENTLTGTAESTIRYADFGLSIPNVPFVARVDEDVILEITFTAKR